MGRIGVGRPMRVAELAEQVDVGAGSRARIRRRERERVTRAKAEGARPVIDGKDGSPHAPERPDRGQSVDERGVADDGRRVSSRAGVRRNAVAVQRRPAPHRADSRNASAGTLMRMRVLLVVVVLAATIVAAGMASASGRSIELTITYWDDEQSSADARTVDASVQPARRHAAQPEACVREAFQPPAGRVCPGPGRCDLHADLRRPAEGGREGHDRLNTHLVVVPAPQRLRDRQVGSFLSLAPAATRSYEVATASGGHPAPPPGFTVAGKVRRVGHAFVPGV